MSEKECLNSVKKLDAARVARAFWKDDALDRHVPDYSHYYRREGSGWKTCMNEVLGAHMPKRG